MGNIDPGAPGKGGGAKGFSAMSTHRIILNKNAENALRRNNHNWGTNIFFTKNSDSDSQQIFKQWHVTFPFRFLQKWSRRGHQVCKTQNWILRTGKHDCNQIWKMPTTGLGVRHVPTMPNIKILHVITLRNLLVACQWMMLSTQRWESEFLFMIKILSYYTLRPYSYLRSYDHTLLCSYDEWLDTGFPHWGSLVYGLTWTI